jgi:hypothetical protein
MKIQNLKTQPDETALSRSQVAPSPVDAPETVAPSERNVLEIAVLKARIQHLELVIEMARGLLGSNQERLLRRLYDVPRELATLSSQLQRVDPHAIW